MLFKLSNLNSNLALTLGYLKPALNDSALVNNQSEYRTGCRNSPIEDYTHPDDHASPTYEMTPGFKPLTVNNSRRNVNLSFVY